MISITSSSNAVRTVAVRTPLPTRVRSHTSAVYQKHFSRNTTQFTLILPDKELWKGTQLNVCGCAKKCHGCSPCCAAEERVTLFSPLPFGTFIALNL